MYKIKELVERKYDFSAVEPEKQQAVRKNTGLDFNLENIVKFLQKQTNNFTKENTIAQDLDEGIYQIVTKFEAKKGKEAPEPTPSPASATDEDEKNIEAIKTILMFGLDDEGKEAIENIIEFGLGQEKGQKVLDESLKDLKKEIKLLEDQDEIKQMQENIDYIVSLKEKNS